MNQSVQQQQEPKAKLEFTGKQIDAILMGLQKLPLETSIEAFMALQQQLQALQQSQQGTTQSGSPGAPASDAPQTL